jgi:hypothetical protein
LGRSTGLPSRSRAAFQRHFMASAPSITASDDPAQAVPGSFGSPGPLKSWWIMRTQRRATSAVRGYSAWSMKLRCRFAAITTRASGSIQVVTNVARFFSGLPSSSISDSTIARAVLASRPCSGRCRSRAGWVR